MLRNCSPRASACAARPWAQPLKIDQSNSSVSACHYPLDSEMTNPTGSDISSSTACTLHARKSSPSYGQYVKVQKRYVAGGRYHTYIFVYIQIVYRDLTPRRIKQNPVLQQPLAVWRILAKPHQAASGMLSTLSTLSTLKVSLRLHGPQDALPVARSTEDHLIRLKYIVY